MKRIRECHDVLFERELSHRVLAASRDVYNALGHGFLQPVYTKSLARELVKRGFQVATQVPAEVRYDDEVVGTFCTDIVVESRLVLAVSAERTLSAADEMQLLNYLRASDLEAGLLLHFGPKHAFRRIAATSPPPRGAKMHSPPCPAACAQEGLRREQPSILIAAPPHRAGHRHPLRPSPFAAGKEEHHARSSS